MKKNCLCCRDFFTCELSDFQPEFGCKDFVSNLVPNKRKNFVLIHVYLETGHKSIVAFSDNYEDLENIRDSHPRYGSNRHYFILSTNFPDSDLSALKDTCLINICKNVAEYLAVGEYSMLKKSYFKSAAWFEKGKNSASLGAVIIENY